MRMWCCLREDLKKHSVRIRNGFEKPTITNVFKPCNNEMPSSETSKSSDLSLMDQVNFHPNVVCNSPDKPFHPPKNFKFPEKRFGKETFNQSCQSQWFEDHQWLYYDIGRDSLFCYVCQNSDDQSQLQALEKFKKYQNSLYHEASLTYDEVVSQCGDVTEMTDKNPKAERELNYKCLMVIIKNVKYFSRQGLPFRRHNDCESNQLLLLRNKDIPQLTDWLMKKNGKYIFHDIQSELLSITSHQVLNKLLVSIRDTMFSLIMMDTLTAQTRSY